MDEKEYQLEIVSQLEKNEVALSELYALYQSKFPTRREFWQGLVDDEQSHAQWIRTLKRKIEEGEVNIKEHRFNIDIINDFNKEVKQKELEINQNNIPLIEALANAVKFEQTLIERRFFEVFKDDSPELEMLLLALEYSTKNHFAAIQKAYNAENI